MRASVQIIDQDFLMGFEEAQEPRYLIGGYYREKDLSRLRQGTRYRERLRLEK